jgi:hypothetical protein
LLALVIALLGANTINIAADLAGMADAASTLCRINSRWFVVAIAVVAMFVPGVAMFLV